MSRTSNVIVAGAQVRAPPQGLRSVLVAGTCWQNVGSHNLGLPEGFGDRRCSHLRFLQRADAMLSCLNHTNWCGGVVEDAGLVCNGVERRKFELRTGRRLPRSHSREAWVLVGQSVGGPPEGDGCASLVASLEKATLAESKARGRAAAKARLARRAFLSDRARRCHAHEDWRWPLSPEDVSSMLDGRPSCPADWLTVWPQRQRVSGALRNKGCCTADASELVYAPCNERTVDHLSRSSRRVRMPSPASSHSGAGRANWREGAAWRSLGRMPLNVTVREAARALAGQRVLIVGDS